MVFSTNVWGKTVNITHQCFMIAKKGKIMS